MIFLIIALLLILLAFFGTPLFIVIGTAALLGLHFGAHVTISSAISEMYRLASQSFLIAIPLFTFAGYLLAESKAPERLVNLSRAFLGWLPGGLAIVALISCSIFTALTGASGVTIIALGGLLYPMLQQEKYSEDFNLGLITSSGSLGILFPPSLPLIVYGLISGVSVDKLFIAGILPGLITIVFLSIYSVVKGAGQEVVKERFSLKKALFALKNAGWEIPLPIIIIAGIYLGFFTAAEAAAISAFYAFIVEVFIYRDIPLRKLPHIMKETIVLVGGILIILGAALAFTNYLVDQRVPMTILLWMKKYFTSKLTFLLILNIFLLIVGCLMDIFSATVVVVPIIAPLAQSYGIDPVHLGIIFLTNLQIGYSTPPVGINLFISSFRFSKPIVKLYWASLPFIVILLIALLFITYYPPLSLKLVALSGVK